MRGAQGIVLIGPRAAIQVCWTPHLNSKPSGIRFIGSSHVYIAQHSSFHPMWDFYLRLSTPLSLPNVSHTYIFPDIHFSIVRLLSHTWYTTISLSTPNATIKRLGWTTMMKEFPTGSLLTSPSSIHSQWSLCIFGYHSSSLDKLNALVPHLSLLKSLNCKVCQLYKHVRVSFPSRASKRSMFSCDIVRYDI